MSDKIWWEKTVEYRFLQMFFAIEGEKNIAPLDGNAEEHAGDALANIRGRWFLIEFKRNKSCLDSEKCKYKNYQESKKSINNQDGEKGFNNQDKFHYLIYGCQGNGALDLKIRSYWDDSQAGTLLDIQKAFLNEKSTQSNDEQNTSYKEFCNYLNFLKEQRIRENGSNKSGGGGSIAIMIEKNSLVMIHEDNFKLAFGVDISNTPSLVSKKKLDM